ncbi:MAG: hypothetical protein COC01_05115 [Bacteroidetes bacterium]|nr:MAG: hypothetical protein COC01_05115 [Bacteroidota bacterium]
MLRHLLGISIVLLVSFIVLSNSVFINDHKTGKSAGAPVGTTGAPGDQSCGTNGCHDQRAENSGPGSLLLEFNNGSNFYVPGSTYPIKITINEHDSITKFGFQLTVLDNGDSTTTGSLSLDDAVRTQILRPEDGQSFYGRQYVTHTYEGNRKLANGYTSWSLNWTAPDVLRDSITFYISTNASNNDLEMTGDYIYTTSLAITPYPTALQEITRNQIKIYPNPVYNGRFFISSNNPISLTDILVFDIYGNYVEIDRKRVQGNKVRIDFMRKKMSKGIYLVKYQVGLKPFMKKLVVFD